MLASFFQTSTEAIIPSSLVKHIRHKRKTELASLRLKAQCTVIELYREGVTKLFHQMEVNETFTLFYIWQMKENTQMSHVSALHIISKKWLFLLKTMKHG